jgi:hypothetical protein
MNILHFGCSWSAHFPDDGEDTVPTYTSQLLLEQGIDHKYYVAAKSGGSVEEQCNLMFSAFEVFENIDFVVFQLTSPYRGFIPFTKPDIRPESAKEFKGIYRWRQHRQDSLMYSGPNIHWKNNEKGDRRIEKYINDIIKYEKNNPYFRHVSYITFIKQFLTLNNLPHVVYTHQWDPKLDKYKKITESIVEFNAVDYLGGWDKCIKQYGDADQVHLTSEGNRRIAKELLLPRIIKQIS